MKLIAFFTLIYKIKDALDDGEIDSDEAREIIKSLSGLLL